MGKKICLLVECKWTANIGKNQGVNKNYDQIEIRQLWKNGIGKKIFPNHGIHIIFVGNVRLPAIYSITWEEIAEFKSLFHDKEFADYLRWKNSFIND
jgi:hypothetical protein